MSVTTEFKEFVLRGNVVDLAVGVLIGAEFGKVVTAFTADFITPLLTIFGSKKVDFSSYAFHIGNATFQYGAFVNEVISFLIMALIVFIFVVKPINWLMERSKSKTPAEETTRECPECLSKIPIAAKRCLFCTAVVGVGV